MSVAWSFPGMPPNATGMGCVTLTGDHLLCRPGNHDRREFANATDCPADGLTPPLQRRAAQFIRWHGSVLHDFHHVTISNAG